MLVFYEHYTDRDALSSSYYVFSATDPLSFGTVKLRQRSRVGHRSAHLKIWNKSTILVHTVTPTQTQPAFTIYYQQEMAFDPDQSHDQNYVNSCSSFTYPQTYPGYPSNVRSIINIRHRHIAVPETQLARALIDIIKSDPTTVCCLQPSSAATLRSQPPVIEHGLLDLKRQIHRNTKVHAYLAQELR